MAIHPDTTTSTRILWSHSTILHFDKRKKVPGRYAECRHYEECKDEEEQHLNGL